MIALDSSSSSEASAATSLTYSHTCSGTNRILIVGIGSDDNPGDGDIVTGVTYNGVAMTQIVKRITDNATFTNRYAYLYYLINPASGANNIVVSASASGNIRANSISYTGALQSGQPDAFTSGGVAAATSKAVALTTVVNNCWMVSFGVCVLVGPPSAGTGITARGSGSTNTAIGDSNGALAIGSNSMTWTQSGSDSFNILQASFSPAPEVSIPSGNFQFM